MNCAVLDRLAAMRPVVPKPAGRGAMLALKGALRISGCANRRVASDPTADESGGIDRREWIGWGQRLALVEHVHVGNPC